ncbi:MAG: protoporphyrinogen oxidase, partial [Actinobacteria bacterium]|nr:protoporphyrinogen oxidase [Actinomycetota bacterium]
MRTLVEGLRTRLRSTEIRTCTAVETMSAGGEKGYRLGLRGGDALEAEAVVVATPAPAAATLMSGVDEPVARALRTVRFADTAVATLVYPPGDLQAPPDGSGFLVPLAEGKTIAACTWYSHKWPRAAPPDGGVVLRAFVGRAGREDALDLDDGALTDAIAADLNDAMGISEAPRRWRVSRWDCSLPEYTVGHGERVEHMSKMLESHPRVALAGAAYAGSGMPDCVTSGFAAATKVIRGLRRDGNRLVPTTGKEGT